MFRMEKNEIKSLLIIVAEYVYVCVCVSLISNYIYSDRNY